MPSDDGKSGISPRRSLPPLSETADIAWDDDTAPRIEHDEPNFDRVTVVPEMPPELYAKRMMKTIEEPPPSDQLGSGLPVPGPDPASGTFQRGSEPPPAFRPGSPAPFSPDHAWHASQPFAATAEPSLAPPTRREPPRPIELELSARGSLTLPAGHGEDVDLGFELEGPLDSAGAARDRELRHASSVRDEAPKSLELDLSGLAATASTPPTTEPQLRELKERHAMGDYSGALIVAEGILESDPQHAEALRFAKSCRDVLTQMYASRLGALDQVVAISIPNEQIRWLSLDHRAGFLLSLVDGRLSVEEVLDISGMPRLDALRILYSLVEEQVIKLRPRAR